MTSEMPSQSLNSSRKTSLFGRKMKKGRAKILRTYEGRMWKK
jgi:hypothetical protein